jgi:hypothetical protein
VNELTHDPAALQAFLDAYDAYMSPHQSANNKILEEAIWKAREALRPKPEMEKVLPDRISQDIVKLLKGHGVHSDYIEYVWSSLVTLTMRPVQKDFPRIAPYYETPFEPLPNPSEEDLKNPTFNAIFQAIKTWDVNVPNSYVGYCGLNGSHVKIILDAINSVPVQKQK